MPTTWLYELLPVLSSSNAFNLVFDVKAPPRLQLSLKVPASSIAVAATGLAFFYYGPWSGRIAFALGLGLSFLWASTASVGSHHTLVYRDAALFRKALSSPRWPDC